MAYFRLGMAKGMRTMSIRLSTNSPEIVLHAH